jgi:hypothetical protein
MSELPSPLLPHDSGLSLEALADAHERLRMAFHVTLGLLVILTFSLFVFFLRETSLARRQIAEMAQFVAQYEKGEGRAINDFRIKLQGFAKTHPDFVPVYNKYFGSNTPAGGPNSAQPVGEPPSARMPPSQ